MYYKKKMIAAIVIVQMFLCFSGCSKKTAEEGLEKPVSEMTTAEKLTYLTIQGQNIGLPCKVGDLTGGLELGNGIPLATAPDTAAACQFRYLGEQIGTVFIDACPLGSGKTDMSEGYEDKWIYCISRAYTFGSSDGQFELLGVTYDSTMKDVIKQWGEPAYRDETSLVYMDSGVDPEQEENCDQISLYFQEDGAMQWYCFTVNPENIKE